MIVTATIFLRLHFVISNQILFMSSSQIRTSTWIQARSLLESERSTEILVEEMQIVVFGAEDKLFLVGLSNDIFLSPNKYRLF